VRTREINGKILLEGNSRNVDKRKRTIERKKEKTDRKEDIAN
jgi:hypothetical protein